jgi:hypothetical protein
MSCLFGDQWTLAGWVYAWASTVLVIWSWRHASADGWRGRVFLILIALFWPVTVLLATPRRSP